MLGAGGGSANAHGGNGTLTAVVVRPLVADWTAFPAPYGLLPQVGVVNATRGAVSCTGGPANSTVCALGVGVLHVLVDYSAARAAT